MGTGNQFDVDNNCQQAGLSCKLTTAALQERKAVAIAQLKKKIIEKIELPNGYAFSFDPSDEMLDTLFDFIRTERICCDFFTFHLSLNKKTTWLELTGPEGVKNFIVTEMEL